MGLARLNTAKAANEGRVMQVLDPQTRTPAINEKTGGVVSITLRGRDSDAHIAAEMQARNEAMDRMQQTGRWTAEEVDQKDTENLARLVVGWDNVPACWVDGSSNEAPVDFSLENAVALFSQPGLRWLRADADKFVARRDAFLKPAPKG